MSSNPSSGASQKPPGAAMEAGGFYNRHSAMQAAGISLVLADWEHIIRQTVIDNGPIVVADYGASQGRNSMPPMRIAIEELRTRVGPDQPISVVHTDLPSNDFATLFSLLADDPSSYMKASTNVFPSVVGRSYFEPILPPASVNLGWNTWTVHWLGAPVQAPDHVFAGFSSDEKVLQKLAEQQTKDWRSFLKSRAAELKPGAFMLSAFVGSDDQTTGWTWIGDHFWASIQQLAAEGLLNQDELLNLTIHASGRTLEQIHQPFDGNGCFEGLKLVKAEMLIVPDGIWTAFQKNADAKQLGIAHANTVRGFSGPSVAQALAHRSNKSEIVDRIFAGLAERLSATPQIHEGRLAKVVLQKL